MGTVRPGWNDALRPQVTTAKSGCRGRKAVAVCNLVQTENGGVDSQSEPCMLNRLVRRLAMIPKEIPHAA